MKLQSMDIERISDFQPKLSGLLMDSYHHNDANRLKHTTPYDFHSAVKCPLASI